MNKDKILDRELVRMIMGSLGIVPPPNFGKVGITTDEFLLEDTLSLDFEDNQGKLKKQKFGIWSGKASYGGQDIRVLFTDICDNETNYNEFILVYNVNNSSNHMLRHIYHDDDDVLFLTKSNKSWVKLGMYHKLITCAGFYNMANIGIRWSKCEDYNDLYEDLVSGIEM
jgi:hypothetical protein